MQNNRCIVFCGFFDPPVMAHERLMLHAMSSSGAPYGIFVPSDSIHIPDKPPMFPGSARLRMLSNIAARHSGVSASSVALGDKAGGHMYRAMSSLQKLYPKRELYFLLPADRLQAVARWHGVEEFLDKFHMAVVHVPNTDAQKTILENPVLASRAGMFLHLPPSGDAGAAGPADARDAIRRLTGLLDPETAMLCMDEIARGNTKLR